MNELQIKVFENADFGRVRTAEIDGKPYFSGYDVATTLGYFNPRDALRKHCPSVAKRDVEVQTGVRTNGEPIMQFVEMSFISESDVYRLIVRSKLPTAQKFESWVFDEVLPSIRKTGLYATDQAIDQILNDPDFGIRLLQELKQSRKEAMEAQKQIAESEPKIEFYDKVLQSENLMTATEIAKDFGWSAHKLNKFLEEKKVQYRQSGRYLLYADYSDRGLAQSRTFVHTNREGEEVTDIYLCWTQKGREIIYNLLKSEGVYPEAHKVANQ